MKRVVALVLVLALAVSPFQIAWAVGDGPTFASALVPGLGQIMNDDHHTWGGKLKILTMWLIELGAIITTPILGAQEGWPLVMIGVGIFLVNHWWSAHDAWRGAVKREVPTEGSSVR